MTPDPDKQIDLDPSEWSRDEPLHQTVLTPEGRRLLKLFAILFPIGLAATAVMTFIVTGHFPYWIRQYLPYEWEGLTTGQTAILLVLIIGVPFALDIGLRLLRSLRG